MMLKMRQIKLVLFYFTIFLEEIDYFTEKF